MTVMRLLMIVICLSVFSSMARAEELAAITWPRFQGPMSTAVAAEKVPSQWSATDNLLWKTAIEGYGQSSPVAWDGQVYVTSISGPQKENCHITAFELASGKKVWQYDLKSATQAENTNYISKAAPTPAVDAAGVICFFEGGNLVALDHAGKVRWERNLVTEFGAIESRHGLAASVEQAADRVYVWVERQKEPYVLAVDKQSGKDLWKAPGIGATSWASPRLVPVDGGEHLVLSGIGNLVGLDPANGEVLWKFDGIAGNSTPTPFPVGKGRFLIGATVGRGEEAGGKASDSNGLIEIRKGEDGKFAADFVWRAQKATSSFGSPMAHAGRAYFVNATGVLFCLGLETGDEQFNGRIGDSLWATPLPLGDRLCLPGKNGKVTMIATGSKLEKLAENTVWAVKAPPPMAEGAPRAAPGGGGPVLYAAIAVGEKLLIRRGDALYCVGK